MTLQSAKKTSTWIWIFNSKNQLIMKKLWVYSWGFLSLYIRGDIPQGVQVQPSVNNDSLHKSPQVLPT